MNVGFVCSRTVVVIRRHETLLDAAQIMRDEHVGSLVVVDDSDPRQPLGVLTDRDLVVSVLAQDPEDLGRLVVGDIASPEVVGAEESESLDDALTRMRVHGIRRLPVVDADGRLVGILTLDDLLELFADQLSALAQVVGREQQIERQMRPSGRATFV